jgi:hypothetical protein
MRQNPASELQDSNDHNQEPILELQVVRHRAPGAGRPLFLTAKRFVRICKLIEQGASAVDACRHELVTYAGFRKHIQRHPSYGRRLKQAEAVRESFLKEFHINNLTKHAPRSVLASLWYLERRFPAEFALRAVHRDQALTEKPIGTEISAEQLTKYGALMLGFAKQEEARAAKTTRIEPLPGIVSQ